MENPFTVPLFTLDFIIPTDDAFLFPTFSQWIPGIWVQRVGDFIIKKCDFILTIYIGIIEYRDM